VKSHSFSLVELMIVAIIVAILAAVAVVLMRGHTTRAMATEAYGAMGTIRTALRINYAETRDYGKRSDGTAIDCTNLPGLKARDPTTPGDLDGRYWDQDCYQLAFPTPDTYVITATGKSDGPTDGVTITLTETGTFTKTGF
jgi:type II secretory pathway pseudopilin PulG